MEFCPKCGGMLLPNKGNNICRTCGYETDLAGNENSYKQKEEVVA